jgi:hypothetical protein
MEEEKKEVYPWHLLDPKYEKSDDDLFETRLGICKECPVFRKATKQCKACGCIMTLKAKLKDAKCPIGKW